MVYSKTTKMHIASFLLVFALLLPVYSVFGHGVQVGYCVTNSGMVRVWIEHWHGPNVTIAQLANAPVQIRVDDGNTVIDQFFPAQGTVANTTFDNLPDCKQMFIQTSACNAISRPANSQNNWAYWDFSPPACDIPLIISVISVTGSQSFYFDEGCGELYPTTFNATFPDCVPPTISCPADLTVNPTSAVDCSAAVTSGLDFTVIFDDCTATADLDVMYDITGATVRSGTGIANGIFNIGTSVVTYTVTDESGKSVTCSFSVTVVDNQPPIIDCSVAGSLLNQVCSSGPPPQLTAGNFSPSDNCTATGDIVFSVLDVMTSAESCPAGSGNLIRTYTFADEFGNESECVQTITFVDDTSPPTLIGAPPANAILECNQAAPPVPTLAFTDNCDTNVSVDFFETFSPDPSCPSAFVITRNWIAEDDCGNQTAIMQSISIDDTTPPTFPNPVANLVLDCNDDAFGQIAVWLNGVIADDNCGPATVTDNWSGTIPDLCVGGTQIVTFTATDLCGNESTTTGQIITQADTDGPLFLNCPSDFTINLDASECDDMVSVVYPIPVATDCNDPVSVSLTSGPPSGGLFPNNVATTVEYTATDACGNPTVCSFDITPIVSNEFEIRCPVSPFIVCADDGACTWMADGSIDPVVTICNDYTLMHSVTGATIAMGLNSASNVSFEIGTSTVTYQLKDETGAVVVQCSFNVIVEDCEPPSVSCLDELNVECGSEDVQGWINNTISAILAGGGADCDIAVNAEAFLEVDISSCGNSIEQVYTFVATDAAGNSTSTSCTYESDDTIDPMISAATNLMLECDGTSQADEIIEWLNINGGSIVISEVCGDVTWMHDFTAIDPACQTNGMTQVTFTAMDECENTTTTTADIIISDSESPTITCPSDIRIECGNLNNTAIVESWLAGAFAEDNCGPVTVSDNFSSLPSCGQTTLVTFTVEDNCDGEVVTCTAVIGSFDTQKPIIMTPPSDLFVECDGSADPGGSIAAWLANDGGMIAVDACDMDLTISTGFIVEIECGDAREIQYTFTATDECGNLAISEIATVHIVDSEAPTLTPPTNTVINCTGPIDRLTWVASATAVDVCDPNATVVPHLLDVSTMCVGTTTSTVYTYRFVATDGCGNYSDMVNRTYTVVDNAAPTITPPPTLNLICGDDYSGEILAWLDNYTIADNCKDESELFVTNNFTMTPPDCGGTVTVTWTVSDGCDAMASTTANIVLAADATPPNFINCPTQDITVGTDVSECAAFVNFSIPVAEDCNGIATVIKTTGPDPGTSFPEGSTPIVYTATDNCNNQTTCSFNIIVQDTADPTITCPSNDVVVCADDGSCEWVSDESIMPTGLDNCPIAGIRYSINFADGTTTTGENDASGETFPLETSTVTYQISDGNGNPIGSCSFDVIVNDCEAPVISCNDELNVECGAEDVDTWIATTIAAIIAQGDVADCSDNLMVESFLQVDISGCGNTIEQVYTFIATDQAGNSSTVSCTYKSEDITPPQLSALTQNPLMVDCGIGQDAAITNWLNINGGSSVMAEACGNVTWTNNYTGITAGCGGEGTALVIFTATDECGLSTSLTGTVIVSDNEVPTIICPNDITIQCGDTQNLSDVNAWISSVSSTDNCGDITISNDFTTLPTCGNSVDVTFTVEGNCDGMAVTCMASVAVIDNQKPVVMNPPLNLTVECDGEGNTTEIANWVTANTVNNLAHGMMALDNCTTVTISASPQTPTDECGMTQIIPYVFTATDECGNTIDEVAYVRIIDITAPNLVLPTAMNVVACNGPITTSLNTWLMSASGEDDCGDPTISFALLNSVTSCQATNTIETRTYVFTSTDECGNSVSDQADFIINDVVAPVIVAPSILNLTCGDDFSAEIGAWLNMFSVTETCSDFTVTNNFVGVPPDVCGGTLTVIWTVVDDCGATSSDQSMIIVAADNVIPEFVNCQSNFTVGTDVDACNSVVVFSTPQATDCNGISSISQSEGLASGSVFELGQEIIEFTAVDNCGNLNTCTFTITVVDSDIPIISCPSNAVIACADPGLCMWTSDDGIAPIGVDNCPMEQVSYSIAFSDMTTTSGTGSAEGTIFPIGQSTVTYTVTDQNGNTSSCTFEVIVEDCEAPTITCADLLNVECGSEDVDGWIATTIAAIIAQGDIADCTEPLVVESFLQADIAACGNTVEQIYTFVATDQAGNSSSVSCTYKSDDTIAPAITDATDLEIECGPGQDLAILTWLIINGGSTITTEACGDVIWTNNYVGIANNCGGEGMVTVTFTATDECGLSTSVMADIIISDSEVPTITCPENISLQCGNPQNLAIVESWLTTVGGTDNCGTIMIENDFDGTLPTCDETVTVTFDITENCDGMTVACMADIVIIDNEKPVIMNPPVDLFVECDGAGNTTEIDNWITANTANDIVQGMIAIDNCTAVEISEAVQPASNECGLTQTIPYIFTATDMCGNTIDAIAYVHITDVTNPTLELPTEINTVDCNGPITATLNTWLMSSSSTDDCSDPVVSYALINTVTACSGTNTIETRTYLFTATDECGNNISDQAEFTIVDDVPPVITAPDNLDLSCGQDFSAAITDWLDNYQVVETCGDYRVTNNFTGVPPDVCGGTLTVTWTVVDDCGASTTATSMIIVADDVVPPVLICQTDFTVNVDVDLCESVVVFSNPQATDCNDILIIEQTDGPASGSSFELGDTRIEFTATDNCGLTSTCEFTVTVVDSDIPSISCPSNDVVVCTDPGLCEWTSDNSTDPIFNDNCVGLIATYTVTVGGVQTESSATSGVNTIAGDNVIFPLGTSTVTYTIADEEGNTSMCSFDVVVEDCEAPTLMCIDVMDVACGSEDLDAWQDDILETALDNCTAEGNTIISRQLITDFSSCGTTIEQIYQFTVTDEAGNTTSCLATYETDDTVPPVITEAIDLPLVCDGTNQSTALLAWLNNNGGATFTSDDCSGPVVWTNNYTGNFIIDCGSSGSIDVIFTATDDCGMSSETTAAFSISDITPPVLTVPANITLECSGELNEVIINNWLLTASAIDACDGTVAVTNNFDLAVMTNGCGLTGVTPIVFTAIDACLNPITETRFITIEDTTDPVIDVEAQDLSVECSADNTVAISNWLTLNGMAMASDLCGDITWLNPVASGALQGCGNNTVITYTFTAQDDCGNTSTTTASVITSDTMEPTLVLPTDQLEECGNITLSLADWLLTAEATDDCGSATVSNELLSEEPGCGGTSVLTYVFTATDDCGNESTGTATYSTEDTSEPTITCPMPLVLECGDANNELLILQWLSNARATDEFGCSEVTITHDYDNSIPALNCIAGASLTVTFTATDGCGNTDVCTQTITINDTTDPYFVNCPANQTVNVDLSDCTSNVVYSTPVALDHCDEQVAVTFTSGIESGMTFPEGPTDIVFTATDDCGNAVTCEFTITVFDSADPSINCPSNDVVVCTDQGTCEWISDDSTDPIFNDNCANITVTYTVTMGGLETETSVLTGINTIAGDNIIFPLGTSTVNYLITDEEGNTSMCSFDVVVEDCEAPSVMCSDVLDVECGSEDLDAWMADILAAAEDNCTAEEDITISRQLLTDFSSCGTTFEQVYQFTVTDEAGNSTSCLATYETDDTMDPMITDAADLPLQCDGTNQSTALLAWLNNNGGATFVSDNCSGPVVWTNNYTGNLTIECGASGSVDVMFTATDGCGNSSTTMATFSISDTAPPALSVPANITLECAGELNEVIINNWLLTASAIDACDGTVAVTNNFSTAVMTDGCGLTGVTTVTFTTADACLNTITADRTITIEDTTNPVIEIGAQDLPVECSTDNTAAIANWLGMNGMAVASDLCGGITWLAPIASAPVPGTCGDNTVTTYIFTAQDDCGNTSTTTASVITSDTMEPTLLLPTDQLEECGNITLSLADWLLTAEATDDCGSATVSNELLSEEPGCGGTSVLTYVFTATDDCGNESTGTATYSTEDTSEPTITCPMPLVLECGDANNELLILQWLSNATATDEFGCSEVTITHDYDNSIPALNCIAGASLTVTFTATDGCGNTDLCTQTITINDTIDPYFVNCPADQIVNVDLSDCTSNVVYSTPVALDHCDEQVAVTFTSGIESGMTFPEGPTDIVFTATDDCGNAVTCEFTITVFDSADPSINCPSNDVVVCTDQGTCEWISDDSTDPIFNDNCDGIIVTYTVTAGGVVTEISGTTGVNTIAGDNIIFPLGTSTVNYLITDEEGNTSMCSFDVVVEDCEAPSVMCSDVLDVECGSEDLDAWMADILATAEDNCTAEEDITISRQLLTDFSSCGTTFEQVYQFTVTDEAGNSTSCLATYETDDTMDPMITDAADLPLQCDGTNQSTALLAWLNNNGGATFVSDNCNGPVVWTNNYTGNLTIDCGASGSVDVMFTATDGCGNSSTTIATFSISDMAPPALSVPANITLECAGELNEVIINNWLLTASAIDACDGTVAVTNNFSTAVMTDGCGLTGVTTVTFTTTDACLNTITEDRTITIEDSTNPVIEIGAQDLPVECSTDNTAAIANWLGMNGMAVASDLCGGITWLAPVASAPVPGTCGDNTVTTYIFTAQDDCGNTSTTTASVITSDTMEPTLVLPTDQLEECGDIQLSLADWLLLASATDDCGSATVSSELLSEELGCGGTRVLTYVFIATDDCGNESTGTATYSTEDTSDPTIVCPTPLLLECGDANNELLILQWLSSATATDEFGCSEVTITHDYDNSIPALNCIAGASLTVTFTATDGCGNIDVCTQTITINDTVDPYFVNCPANQTVNVDLSDCTSNVVYSTPVALDHCDEQVAVTFTSGIESGMTFPEGPTDIIFTATDDCGNAVTCEFTITVFDSADPSINCPSNDVVVCTDAGTCEWISDDSTDPIFNDNCANIIVTYTVTAGGVVTETSGTTGVNTIAGDNIVFPLGTSTVNYLITDEEGNTASCSFDVVVQDCEAPSLMCSDVLNVECGSEDFAVWQATILATATDNCSLNADITITRQLITDFSSCGTTVEQVYQFTVRDEAGNSTSCLATYETDDTMDPMITDAADLPLQCDGTIQSTALLAWLNNNGGATFVSDNCSGPVVWTNNYTGNLTIECGASGSVDVTFTATDGCGNSSTTVATFSISDTAPPALSVPANITLECAGELNEVIINNWLLTASAIDACDGTVAVTNNYDTSVMTDGCGLTGVTTVTFTTTDACLNTITADRTITIEDTTDPIIEIESEDLVLECADSGNQGLMEAWLVNNGGAIASDDCGDITWLAPIEGIQAVGCAGNTSTEYTFTVEDECGNSSTTSASVIFIDTTIPIVSPPSDLTVECDGSGNLVDLQNWIDSATGSDLCSSIVTVTEVIVNTISSCGSTNAVVYEFTSTDDCGNSASAQATFTIEDTTPPLPMCCPDFTISIGSLGFETFSVNDFDCGSTDVCTVQDRLDIQISKSLFTIDDLGANEVTLTITDECGNSSTCTTIVTVVQDPAIGIAKRAVDVVNNPDGSSIVTYELNIVNYGDVDLTNVQVMDDLGMTFPSPCMLEVVSISSAEFIENLSFNGTSDMNLLEGNNNLPIGQGGSITFAVLVSDCATTGPFANSATVQANAPNGDLITDISQDGTNPDLNGDGIPVEQEPTIVSFESVRALGIAKNLVTSNLNPDGSFNVTYEFNIENFSNTTLTNLQVTDDLIATFPPSCLVTVVSRTSNSFSVNTLYNGIGINDLLTGTDDIDPGETGSINLEVFVENCGDFLGPFENTAQVQALDPLGVPVTDDSVDGTDPDPDGNNNPDELSPTIVDFNANPGLGVAKRVSQGPLPNPDGSFDVVYEIRVENVGDIDLVVDQVLDTLSNTFMGAAGFEVIGVESEEFVVNTNYDGVSDFNLIVGDETLVPGEEATIYITVNVEPGTNLGPYFNSVTANGLSAVGGVSDVSQDGAEIDPDNIDGPGNNSDPTPVSFECINMIVCPNVQDTIRQPNDPGWCQAIVNLPLAEARICAGFPEPVFEYLLEGVGADGVPIDTWVEGQPGGLQYLVGITKVNIRFGFEDLTLGFSDTCMFHIEILDKEKPIFTAGIPVDMFLSCEEVLDTFVMTPSQVQDNCGEPTIEFEIISDRVMDPADCGYYNYIDTMRYILSDDAANTCFFDQVVTYSDLTPPLLILPADTTIAECQVAEDVVCRDSIFEIGQVDTTLLIGEEWVITTLVLKDTVQLCDTLLFDANDPSLGASLATAIDNCAPLDVLNIYYTDSLDILCKGDKAGIIYRKWFAEDPCGNIDSAIQEITILDKNPPELICNTEATVTLGTDGTVTVQTSDVVASLFDACFSYSGSLVSNIDVNITPPLFNCNDLGQHTVLVSATDPCNNRTSYCEVSLTVVDEVAPVLTCPTDPITLNVIEGNCRATAPELNDILGVGDCSVVLSTEPDLFVGLPIGTHDIVITATDAAGNQSSCVATFIVDGEPVDFSSALSCNNKINASLGGECSLVITPDMVLENDGALCTDFLCLEIEGPDGVSHENFFDITDINTEFKVRVVDCNGSQNSCWSTVLIEEKQQPVIEWPEDVDVLCIEPTIPDYFKVGYPEILNCESEVDMSYVDTYKEFERCLDIRASIDRLWTVVDDEGNSQSYTQIINILPFSLEHVSFPVDITIQEPINCNDVMLDSLLLHPDSTGMPSIFGLPLDQNGGLCLFSMLYEDRIFEICDGSFEILRTWFVRDVCGTVVVGENPLEHVQVITVFDFDGPTFESCGDTIQVSVNPWVCTYTGSLPIPDMLMDNCSDITIESYVTNGGYIDVSGTYALGNLQINAINIPYGIHEITYIAKDQCRNVSICNFSVDVIDEVAPNAVCKEGLTVTLSGSNDGIPVAKVFANQLNVGSHDSECGPVSSTVLLKANYDAGQVYLDSGSPLIIAGLKAYHFVEGCEPTGEIRDTLFDKDNEIEEIEVIPFVLADDFIKLCCENQGVVTATLIITDESGNENTCDTDLTIVDQLGSTIVCEDYAVACVDNMVLDPKYPSLFGANCGSEIAMQYIDEEFDASTCSNGYISRTWYLDADASGDRSDTEVSCIQRISFNAVDSAFDPFTIKWPIHYKDGSEAGKTLECEDDAVTAWENPEIAMGGSISCMGEVSNTSPVWCEQSCGLVGLSVDIDTLVSGGSCLKIVKSWTVVDWCVWQPNSSPDVDSNPVEAIHDQTEGVCSSCPNAESASPVPDYYMRYISADLDGYYTYDQVIEILDDTDPVLSLEDSYSLTAGLTNCTVESSIILTAQDYCDGNLSTNDLLAWTAEVYNDLGELVSVKSDNGSSFELNFAGQTGQVFIVDITVSDGCKNSDSGRTTVTIVDEQEPSAVCIALITTSIDPTAGQTILWAKDFNVSSSDNCTSVDDLRYSIITEGVDPIRPGQAGFNGQANYIISCDDLEQSLVQSADMWVWDESGNGSFCTATIRLDTLCADIETGFATIAGHVSTETNQNIAGATIRLNTNLSEYPKTLSTDDQGEYSFPNNPINVNYLIRAAFDDAYHNGVTTADLLLIQNHIIGKTTLDSPYKTIAADANSNQEVSIADVLILRRIILGIDVAIESSPSWIFIPRDFDFVNELNPWPFEPPISVNQLLDSELDHDFIGIKLGDVNASASLPSFIDSEVRNKDKKYFTIVDKHLSKNEVTTIPIYGDAFTDIRGFQLSMDLAGIEIEDIVSGQIQIDNSNFAIYDDVLTMSWTSELPISKTEEDVLFSIRIRSKKAGDIHHLINLNKVRLESEIYATDAIVPYDLEFQYEESIDKSDHTFELLQNEPNPFVDQTTIGFSLPSAGQIEFSVYDAVGKEWYSEQKMYEAGYSEILLDKSQLMESGIYYYKLIFDNNEEVKTLFVLSN